MKVRKSPIFRLVLIVLAMGLCAFSGFFMRGISAQTEEQPLGCLSLNSSEDYYSFELGQSFQTRMNEMEYASEVTYCDYDINLQLNQLNNFLAQEADLIVVYRAGEPEAYNDFFTQARKNGCKTITIDQNGVEELCDVSVENYEMCQGMRACELIKQYLDQEYPEAGPDSVLLLLLEAGDDVKSRKITAGYRLISEKFYRYYDVKAGTFVHEKGEPVYYLDENNALREVEEDTGGLILDKNGYAQLNPYYDERICISSQRFVNIHSNLEGQEAVDTFMMTPEGRELRIVVGLTFNSAIGAAEKMQYYLDNGLLDSDSDGLAVFGLEENKINNKLVQDSLKGEGLLRGFVAQESPSSLINGVMSLLNAGGGAYHMNTTSRSERIPGSYRIGMARVTDSRIMNLEDFYI